MTNRENLDAELAASKEYWRERTRNAHFLSCDHDSELGIALTSALMDAFDCQVTEPVIRKLNRQDNLVEWQKQALKIFRDYYLKKGQEFGQLRDRQDSFAAESASNGMVEIVKAIYPVPRNEFQRYTCASAHLAYATRCYRRLNQLREEQKIDGLAECRGAATLNPLVFETEEGTLKDQVKDHLGAAMQFLIHGLFSQLDDLTENLAKTK